MLAQTLELLMAKAGIAITGADEYKAGVMDIVDRAKSHDLETAWGRTKLWMETWDTFWTQAWSSISGKPKTGVDLLESVTPKRAPITPTLPGVNLILNVSGDVISESDLMDKFGRAIDGWFRSGRFKDALGLNLVR